MLKIVGVEYQEDAVPVGIRVELPADGFEEEGVISFDDLWKVLAESNARTAQLPSKNVKIRAFVLDAGGRPSLCTVTAQPAGNFFVRVDGQGGSSFHGSHLVHRIFPIESLPLLIGRWMTEMVKSLRPPRRRG